MNIFGVGPLGQTEAPNYVKSLKDSNMIESETVFIYLNPFSTLTDENN